jgi:peroxiredoxin
VSRKTVLNIPTWSLIVIVFALGAVVIGGCGDKSAEDETAAEQNAPEAQAAPAAAVAGGKGSPAPDFTLKKLSGGELQLSSLRGKAVILDFWDTWCPPCKKALPHLQELSETYSDDLVVVGVAMGREGEDKVRSFTKAKGLTFEMVLFNNDMNLIKNYGGFQSIPTTFLIDEDGVVREKWVGAFSKAEYERALKEVLGG